MNRPSFWFAEIVKRRAMGLMPGSSVISKSARAESPDEFHCVYVLSVPYRVLSDNPGRKKTYSATRTTVPSGEDAGTTCRSLQDHAVLAKFLYIAL